MLSDLVVSIATDGSMYCTSNQLLAGERKEVPIRAVQRPVAQQREENKIDHGNTVSVLCRDSALCV
jgi:hypothetical protein